MTDLYQLFRGATSYHGDRSIPEKVDELLKIEGVITETTLMRRDTFRGDTCLHALIHVYECDNKWLTNKILEKIAHLITPEMMRAKTDLGETCWHHLFSSVKCKYSVKLIERLFPLLSREDLYVQDNYGNTLVHNLCKYDKYFFMYDVFKMLHDKFDLGDFNVKMHDGETYWYFLFQHLHSGSRNIADMMVSHLTKEIMCDKVKRYETMKHINDKYRKYDSCWNRLFMYMTDEGCDFFEKHLLKWVDREVLDYRSHDGESLVDALIYDMTTPKFRVFKMIYPLIQYNDFDTPNGNGFTSIYYLFKGFDRPLYLELLKMLIQKHPSLKYSEYVHHLHDTCGKSSPVLAAKALQLLDYEVVIQAAKPTKRKFETAKNATRCGVKKTKTK